MTQPWTCPAYGRGVAPGEKTCDHGAATLPFMPWIGWPGSSPPYQPTAPMAPNDLLPLPRGACPACAQSGVCNCTLNVPVVTCSTVANAAPDNAAMHWN